MKISTERKIQLNNLKERAVSLLYPRVCPGCGKLLGRVMIPETGETERDAGVGVQPVNPYICPDCYSRLDFLEDTPRCMCCSKPLDSETDEYCSDCMEKERYFSWGRALMVHAEPARKIMYDLKYSNLRDNGDFLGYEMAVRMADIVGKMDAQAIIPVPLHRKRELERGYNQAGVVAEKMKFFMDIEGIPCPEIDSNYLARKDSTSRLKEVSGGRRAESLWEAFAVEGEPGRYRRVILVDDIYTTGATINECAKTLRRAGTDVVYFITCTVGS